MSRSASQAMDRDGNVRPKPTPARKRGPENVRLPGQQKLTASALGRERRSALDAIRLGERAARRQESAA